MTQNSAFKETLAWGIWSANLTEEPRLAQGRSACFFIGKVIVDARVCVLYPDIHSIASPEACFRFSGTQISADHPDKFQELVIQLK